MERGNHLAERHSALDQAFARSTHSHDKPLHVAFEQVRYSLREVVSVESAKFVLRQGGRLAEVDGVELIPPLEYLGMMLTYHA